MKKLPPLFLKEKPHGKQLPAGDYFVKVKQVTRRGNKIRVVLSDIKKVTPAFPKGKVVRKKAR